ncbi:hypothetical protein, partial [Clostridium haemolyticum]|uniref:hypothetical protein n=1 Tax=Clostridium haemolyticum TaxID=84025 RepID=UPI0013014C09
HLLPPSTEYSIVSLVASILTLSSPAGTTNFTSGAFGASLISIFCGSLARVISEALTLTKKSFVASSDASCSGVRFTAPDPVIQVFRHLCCILFYYQHL